MNPGLPPPASAAPDVLAPDALRRTAGLRRSRWTWRRLARIAGLVLIAGYLLMAAAGYAWLRYQRDIDQVGFLDVALLRWTVVRHGLAAQHFNHAQKEWLVRDYPAAYLSFTSAVRNDPDNIAGRLQAAEFLVAVGAVNQAGTLLEQGLARAPDDATLITRSFGLLLASGRDRVALDLLRSRYASKLAGPNGSLLLSYALSATLRTEGAPAAARLLQQYPALRENRTAALAVAQVLWESQEQPEAIRRLAAHVADKPGEFAPYALLAGWQLDRGLLRDAQRTAAEAIACFPQEIEPRLLQIETLSVERGDFRHCQREIESYLHDFAGRPKTILLLAGLCGRRGWPDLAYALYELGTGRKQDLRLLALYYGDALAIHGSFEQAGRIFAQLEVQTPDGDTAFLLELNQRQVMAAASLGDHERAREFARHVAAALQDNPRGRELVRRHFGQMGIPEAVAELADPVIAPSRAMPAAPVSPKAGHAAPDDHGKAATSATRTVQPGGS